ncbi:MAG: hypothetical protein MI923_28055 [Phycisphaerales bacterium]|nr:hypothetical protein [Phycisphaerales bacterium]
MAKEDYLSIDQVTEALGMTEEQVKNLVKDGKLSEVRDAGKVLFKKAEVDQLGNKEGSSVVELDASDEDLPAEIEISEDDSFASALSSLADSSATLGAIDESPGVEEPPALDVTPGAGSSIAFAPEPEADSPEPTELTMEDIPEELPAAPKADKETIPTEFSSEIDLLPADDTGDLTAIKTSPQEQEEKVETLDEVPDLGLSGSSIISLEPSGDSGVMDAPITKEDTKFSKVGISVFDDDELDVETDPMGETQISSGPDDFEAVGSGSGLLDLTQESDDTSLGAELLDVISPSDAGETELESDGIEADTITESGSSVTMVSETTEMVTPMPMTPAVPSRAAVGEMAGATPMNVCMILGMLGMALLGLATASVLQGVWPAKILDLISSGVVHYSVFGGLALIAIVTGVLSILADRK